MCGAVFGFMCMCGVVLCTVCLCVSVLVSSSSPLTPAGRVQSPHVSADRTGRRELRTQRKHIPLLVAVNTSVSLCVSLSISLCFLCLFVCGFPPLTFDTSTHTSSPLKHRRPTHNNRDEDKSSICHFICCSCGPQ